MMAGRLECANVVLRGGGLDESRDCCNRPPQVLAARGDTIRIVYTLTSLGVAIAGCKRVQSLQGLTLPQVNKPGTKPGFSLHRF